MRKNVGELDAYIRLVCGFYAIGSGIMKKSRPMIFMGSMKVAEGITRWCPMLALLDMSTREVD